MILSRFLRLTAALLASSAGVVSAAAGGGSIYPDDHWSFSTKLNEENYAETIQSELDSGKTVFVRFIASEAPAWNAVTKLFAESSHVAFMDVNLREARIVESPDEESYGVGNGGWPTIRYFDEETGLAGGTYEKVTSKPMCQELGDEENMIAYIEEYAGTYLCSVDNPEQGCSEKEAGYIAKMKGKPDEELTAQIERLDSMDGASMTPELFKWLKQRKKILRQLVPIGDEDEDDEDEDEEAAEL